MLTFLAIIAYASAMLTANLTVAAWGPWVSPINSFLFIGLDLALRDFLHVRLPRAGMAALIVCTGLGTFLLNPAAGHIALASSVSFMVAAVVDWAVFARLAGSWLRRSAWSNVAGAAVDSIVFPLMAFGVGGLVYAPLQFLAKTAGGTMWAWLLSLGRGVSFGRNEA